MKKNMTFSLYNQDNQNIHLNDIHSKILLYFYPRALTPGCTTQALGLKEIQHILLEHNIIILGISPDPIEKLKKFHTKYDLNFDLLSDDAHEIANLFEVWGPKKFMGKVYDGIHRTSFLLNEHKEIMTKIDKFKTKEHHTIILKWIEEHCD